MRLSFISATGYGLGLATHAAAEGHGVNFLIRQGCQAGQGIIDVHPYIEEGLYDTLYDLAPDVAIFDSEDLASQADLLRKSGRRVIGPTSWSSLIDKDKEYARKLTTAMGWPVADSPNGINLYITVSFNGQTFTSYYTSLVYRRFMAGGHGADLGFMGVLANFAPATDKISQLILKPLEPILRQVNHRGFFHIHTVINGDTFGIRDISASITDPLSLLLFENSRITTTNILLSMLDEASKPIVPLEQWAVGALLSVPPYPYQKPAEPIHLRGIQPASLKHLWLIDARKNGNDWFTASVAGNIGYVTARGSSLQEATRRVYRTINNLEVRDLQYRNDIGRDIQGLLKSLRDNGWVK